MNAQFFGDAGFVAFELHLIGRIFFDDRDGNAREDSVHLRDNLEIVEFIVRGEGKSAFLTGMNAHRHVRGQGGAVKGEGKARLAVQEEFESEGFAITGVGERGNFDDMRAFSIAARGTPCEGIVLDLSKSRG